MPHNSRKRDRSTSHSGKARHINYNNSTSASQSGRARRSQPHHAAQRYATASSDDQLKDTGFGIDTYNGGRVQSESGYGTSQSFDLDAEAFERPDGGFPFQGRSSSPWTPETGRQGRTQETKAQASSAASGSGLRFVNSLGNRIDLVPSYNNQWANGPAQQLPVQHGYHGPPHWNATDEYSLTTYPMRGNAVVASHHGAAASNIYQQQQLAKEGWPLPLPNVPGGGPYIPNPAQAPTLHTLPPVAIPRAPPPPTTARSTCSCEICDQTFTRYEDLDRHVDTQHGKVYYKCLGRSWGRPCTHENKRKDKIKLHCRKHHEDAPGNERYRTARRS